MDQTFIDILVATAKIAPVIAVLWLAIRYFLRKEKVYQEKINELQDELRANERESLVLLNKFTSILDRLLENSAKDKKEIMNEIANLHKDISKKLNDLKRL
jgi:adenosyl cobinamide kinase/adenosyl cobinamide phosphate guanylyltransferase